MVKSVLTREGLRNHALYSRKVKSWTLVFVSRVRGGSRRVWETDIGGRRVPIWSYYGEQKGRGNREIELEIGRYGDGGLRLVGFWSGSCNVCRWSSTVEGTFPTFAGSHTGRYGSQPPSLPTRLPNLRPG